MIATEYHRPRSLVEALELASLPGAAVMGGGTDLLVLIEEGLASPAHLVDLREVPEAREMKWDASGSVRIGAALELATLANDRLLAARFPLLTSACAAVGTPALRNMGTLGGNLCQRPRCAYFRSGFACWKSGGKGCPAEAGENHLLAIFRSGPCHAVHPSDTAVALVALEAQLHLATSRGERTIPVRELWATGDAQRETNTGPGEVLVAVEIPASASGGRQTYLKLMQRGAWDFALVSLAALRREDGAVRLVLGGVANRPWEVDRSLEEDCAAGRLSASDVESLVDRALYDARPLSGNEYKVALARTLLRRGIEFVADFDALV